jgi:hypothetical protein
MSDPKRCLNCGKPVYLVPFLGWVHVGVLDNLMCEEADA